LIAQRTLAKSQRDYAQADLIRQQLLAQGITLKDGAAGTTWQAAAA
jgi:cysteinyl-tRNA synthetase